MVNEGALGGFIPGDIINMVGSIVVPACKETSTCMEIGKGGEEREEKRRKRGGGKEGEVGGRRGGREERWEERRRGTHTHLVVIHVDELWSSVCVCITGDQCPCVGVDAVAIESVLQRGTPQHH